jgi:hypothetical protein
MRVNSTNVLDEGLRIREIGRQMNSKVKRGCKLGLLSICPSPSSPGPIYRWPGLKDREGSDTDYNIDIQHELVFRLALQLGLT